MTATRMTFLSVAVALLVCLGVARPADAYYAPQVRPAMTPGHMPGWDWWRTYPWSPYNYGRNPYNPIILPYPGYVYPYSPLPADPSASAPDTRSAAPAQPDLPTVSGPLTSPPPGTAILRVRVPDTWGEVAFNGHDSITSGKVRTFVTPRLTSAGQSDTVSASFVQRGQRVNRQQVVHVVPGQTESVTFGR